MPLFPEMWLSELLSKNEITNVVSEYVQLKSKGGGHGRLWGCCPFHNEKTPSFSVTQDKQFYYCFGCKRGGDVIKFIMEIESLSYVEAVKFLAQRVGMELPSEVDDDKLRQERAVRERLYTANREAAKYYVEKLFDPEGNAAREYLLKRGLNGKISKRFGLGYAPEGWENLSVHLKEKGFTQRELILAGLAIESRNEGCYDAFRNRVMFPIIGTNDRVLGFGARTMGDDTPKYLNTGDTPIFNKRGNLYALNMQKRKQLADLVLVEGYMDVIGLNRYGVLNAVATLGTSLTQQQARLIKRFAPVVYLCYDGDSAGQNATLRGVDILAKEELNVRVIVIPGSEDPDEFVKSHGAEAFNELKRSALTLNGFKLEHLSGSYNLTDAEGREAYAKAACELICTFQPVEQERYISLVAQKTGMALPVLRAQCGISRGSTKNSIGKYRNTKREKTEETGEKMDLSERTLLACMLISKQAASYTFAKMAEEELEFSGMQASAFANRLMLAYAGDKAPDIRLLAGDEGLMDEIAMAQIQAESIKDPERTTDDCVRELLNRSLKQQCDELSTQVDMLCGSEKTAALTRLMAIQTRLKKINSKN